MIPIDFQVTCSKVKVKPLFWAQCVVHFLAHLSWRLNWAFLIKICCCHKLFTFSSSSPEQLVQFQSNLAQSILGWREFKFVQMKGPAFPREDNYKIAKIHWQILKIFSRTTWPIATKLFQNYPWVKSILNYSSEGPVLFPRGDGSKIVKILWQNLKIFYRSTGPISIKLSE